MIINKVKEIWTDQEKQEFNDLNEQANHLWEDFPIGEDDHGFWEKYEKIDNRRDKIIREISNRYINSFRKKSDREKIFDDIQEIVEDITKEDFREYLKTEKTILKSLETPYNKQDIANQIDELKEDYENCCKFICKNLKSQWRVIKKYKLDQDKMVKIIDKQVSNWYKRPDPQYLPVMHGKATDTFFALSPKDVTQDEISEDMKMEKYGVEYTITGSEKITGINTINVKKFLLYCLWEFTKANNRSTKTKPNLTIKFTLDDYAKALGKDITPDPDKDPVEEEKRIKNIEKRMYVEIKKCLNQLIGISITWEENVRKSMRNYDSINLLQRKEYKNRVITVMFSEPFGMYLKERNLTTIPLSLLKVDPKKSRSAFSIGYKISLQNYNKAFKTIDTNNRLQVRTILDNCTEIPSINKVRTENRVWHERIKEPMENALDELCRVGFLNNKSLDGWKYTHSKGMELTDEEREKIIENGYEAFENLYIEFKVS